MLKRLTLTLTAAAVLAAGCGGLKQPEPAVTPATPPQQNQPAPVPPPAQAAPATPSRPKVTGSVSFHAGGVKWGGGDGKTVGPQLQGTGAITGATVIVFDGTGILGTTTTAEGGWSGLVNVTVATDPRLDLIEGKVESMPGFVNAVVMKEGYRPTLVMGIPVAQGEKSGYGVKMFAENDQVVVEGASYPKDAPYVQSMGPYMRDGLSKALLDEVMAQYEKTKK